MIENDAGRNKPSPVPSSAAMGARATSESICRAARTASTATSTALPASAASITARGLSRSASTPPTGMSTVRGKP